jgi:hypothetical protein
MAKTRKLFGQRLSNLRLVKDQNRVFDQLFGVSRIALTSLWHRIRSEQREISPELAMYEVNRELPVPSMHGCRCRFRCWSRMPPAATGVSQPRSKAGVPD